METNSEIVTPVAVSQESMVYSNKVYLSSSSQMPEHKKYLLLKGYAFCYELTPQIPAGKIGLNKKVREFLMLSLIDEVRVRVFEPRKQDSQAASVTLKIEMLFPPKERTEIDDYKLGQFFVQKYEGFFVSRDQTFVTLYDNTQYIITVDKIVGTEDGFCSLSRDTKFNCVPSADQKIKLRSRKDQQKNVFAKNFSLEGLGIGGLDSQLMALFRRAFASRRLPHSLVQKFGIKHVKGILLHGPPGTGKTLIARQLASTLNAKTFTKVNGPEVFGKFVGESEQNVRKAFQPARDDQRKYGEQSPLHVIVFDEIDAICRQRGSGGDSTNSKDAVVNQLLTNLDGVEALNNIIVIGMTNRKDLLDEAITRPGRLEIHIEIGIPDEEGRRQIFEIHTRGLVRENLLDKDVSLSKLSALTQNYTGAEIEAVVKNASAYAMLKGNDIMDFKKNFTLKKGTTVNMHDFLKAIEEVPPSFGMDQENFETYTRNEVVDYGKSFQMVLAILSKTAKLALSGSKQLVSLLMYGEQGTGKTTIASHFAKQSKFSFIKIISAERFVGVGSMGKINSMYRVFRDAYKSKSSLIVIDNVERIVEYVQTGPDFNNHVMQALVALLTKVPPNPECNLMIIGTTSSVSTMEILQIDQHFGLKLKIPTLNANECKTVLGVNLGICNVPVKRLVHFKSICSDKPKSVWKKMWDGYTV